MRQGKLKTGKKAIETKNKTKADSGGKKNNEPATFAFKTINRGSEINKIER